MTNKTKATTKPIGFLEILVINIIISAGVFFLFNHFFDKEQNIAPPVLIVDYAEINKKLPDDEAESDRIMLKTSELIVQFRDAGFLVLDAQNVISAPQDMYLPLEVVYE